MKTQQALVAVGGQGSRLKASGEEVPVSKSFLTADGKPFLAWCLGSLARAGVRRLVLAAEFPEALGLAEQAVSTLSHHFEEVHYFQDPGLGVHGLPFQARDLLEDTFFFECGHAVNTAGHYQHMDIMKDESSVVFSAFTPHSSNRRQPVLLKDGRVTPTVYDNPARCALAHPLLVDQAYARSLPGLDFRITNIIADYARRAALKYVWSDMPPEFDTAEEMRDFIPALHRMKDEEMLPAD